MESNPLYNEIILEYSDFPRNKRLIEEPDGTSHGIVPSCADDVIITVKLGKDGVEDVAWQGTACAIGSASASMMTETIKSLSPHDARKWINNVRALVTGRQQNLDPSLELGDIEVLEGVSKYPLRIKCALLPWDAVDEALTDAEKRHATSEPHAEASA